MDQEIKLKELAELLGVSNGVIIGIEKELNLKIPRDEKGQRIYNQEWIEYFKNVKQYISQDKSFDEIRKLIKAPGSEIKMFFNGKKNDIIDDNIEELKLELLKIKRYNWYYFVAGSGITALILLILNSIH